MTNKPKSMAFSNILASSVHDMKNSLSMLINTLDEVTDVLAPSDAETAQKLSRLKYESKRVNNNLVQMLTLYKIGNAQYYVDIDEHDVAEFITEMGLSHRELLDQRQITLDFDITDNVNWFFDRTLVAGVINNIVNNAFNYTKDRIKITASAVDKWLIIAIADNGPGYPPDMLTSEADTQTPIDFETGSTGLGLFFSQQVAELHEHRGQNGRIVLDNDGINGGSRFRLFLP